MCRCISTLWCGRSCLAALHFPVMRDVESREGGISEHACTSLVNHRKRWLIYSAPTLAHYTTRTVANDDPSSSARTADSLPARGDDSSSESAPEVLALHGAYSQHRELLSELDHRVRNMLQIVIGLCRLTLRRAADLQAFERALMGRIDALAKSYELLTRAGWQNVSLDELLRAQLATLIPTHRFSVDGHDLSVSGEAVLTMGLLFHELACNARQHGAWSVPDGSVEIIWLTKADRLIFRWVEHGAPQVSHVRRHGFGTELLEGQLRHELGAASTMEFPADGMQLTLVMPLSIMEASETDGAVVLGRLCDQRKRF